MQHLTVTRHEPSQSTLPPVWVTYIAHRKVWLLVEEYHVDILHKDRVVCFEIPQNFEFDLASVPRILWPLISSFELSIVAPLIHDYLYRFHGRPTYHHIADSGGRRSSHITNFTRKDADQIFYDLMIREGVATWKAKAAYRAVRWFGPKW